MWEIIRSGGPVMVPLVACAVLAIAYAIERFWILGHMPGQDEAKEELDRLEGALLNGGHSAVAAECAKGSGVMNYVFASLLKRHDTLLIEQREFQDTHKEIVRLSELGGGGELGRFMVMQQELADLKQELVLETEESARNYLGKNLAILHTLPPFLFKILNPHLTHAAL